MSKITVNKDLCIACATCYSKFPNCFEAGEDGKSQVIDHDYKKHGYDKDEIVNSCASGAISIED